MALGVENEVLNTKKKKPMKGYGKMAMRKRKISSRLKKLNLKAMEKSNKYVKLTFDKDNVMKYQEQRDAAFQILLRLWMLDQPVSIDDLRIYFIIPVTYCTGTINGIMAKRK